MFLIEFVTACRINYRIKYIYKPATLIELACAIMNRVALM